MSQGHGYRVRARTAATAAVANNVIAALWNPHATKRVVVTEWGIFKGAAGTAGDALALVRTTTRGTPGSTVTPGADHDENRDSAPQSGLLLDLAAYTAQPTLAGVPQLAGLAGWIASNTTGSGALFPSGIVIPPGAGLALVQVAATIWPISDVLFRFEE